jgi:flagellar hook-basal body complex protein FliE
MSVSAINAALQAYSGFDSAKTNPMDAGGGGDSFSSMLGRALEGAVSSGKQADTQAMAAVSGHGDLTKVVTAVSQAELALQTTVAMRDRVLQAYQDIIKMPI